MTLAAAGSEMVSLGVRGTYKSLPMFLFQNLCKRTQFFCARRS